MRSRAPIILLPLLATFLIPILVGNVYATSCPPGNCQAFVDSNVPSNDGTIWIEIDNNTSNKVPLNTTLSFPYNTTHTITVLNSTGFTGASTVGHYVWKEWANYYWTTSPGPIVWTTSPTLRICPANSCTPNGIIFNYTAQAHFTAVFDKQYPATFSFSDARGNPLNPAPVSLTLQGQRNGPTTVTNYSGYVTADYYTVTSALWESAIIPANKTQTIDLTNQPATATVSLAAYPATIHIVDNNNNPVSGANVTITFLNGTITSKTFVTDQTGNVHLGDIPCSSGGSTCFAASYGLSVHYQNQEYGPYSPDATTTSTYQVQVSSGSTTTTTTTAIVLLVIFGIAFFLIILAIRVRKPAAPPTI